MSTKKRSGIMKNKVKFLFSAIILLLIAVSLFTTVSAAENKIAIFSVNADESEKNSDLGVVDWYKGADGVYYIFLPANTDKSNITVNFKADADVFCGETKLISGEETSVFANGDTFEITCGATAYKVRFLQADSAGSIYVNTESGNMDAVHADKSHKESGNILILDKNGDIQYDGALDYIKGRGNSTWTLEKKPYNIKLDKKADLFEMGKHKSWCLLANASDWSMIKNQLAYDLARNLGIFETSETFQVNLYLNGEYAGLYLLTEKVDIGENRVDIYDLEGETEDVNDKDLDEYPLAGKQNSRDFGSIKYANIPNNPKEITGGYLLELEKIYRYVNEASGFITNIGQPVVVKTPEYASKAQVEYISRYYQEFEDALYSATGYNSKGKHYSDYIEVDSLARMYIIYEFTSNFDGCSSSFYLWKDVDGKLTAGPLWDFDLSLGHVQPNDLINHVANMGDPNLLYVQTCFIGNHAENKKALLAQAFSHNDFQTRVEELWEEEFETYFSFFYDNIETFRNQAQSSVVMNSIRWNTYGTTNTAEIIGHYGRQVDVVTNFVNARHPFLQNVFAKDTYFVKYDIGKYGKALVHDTKIYNSGDTATVLSAPASASSSRMFIGWSTNPDGTGDVYAAGSELTVSENITLYAQWEKKETVKSVLQNFFKKLADFFTSVIDLFSEIFR